MKKIVYSLLATLMLVSVYAEHNVGGEITYRYIGDSTNTPYEYEVTLTLYRADDGSPQFGNSNIVSISSSCYASQNITVNCTNASTFCTGRSVNGVFRCIDTSQAGAIYNITLHTYKGTVVLPGKCTDFRFEHSVCCRPGSLTNIAGTAATPIYLHSTLNNTLSPNSSTTLLNDPLVNLCLNTPANIQISTIEPNGDSVSYTKGIVRTAAGSPATLASGYTQGLPMSSSTGYQLDSFPSFTPNQIEFDAIAIKRSEYRYNINFGLYYLVGEVNQEFTITVTDRCKKDSALWPVNTSRVDTTAEYTCGDSTLILYPGRNLLINSFKADGSDFRVLNLRTKILKPVTQAQPVSYLNAPYTDAIRLKLHTPIEYNDTLLIYLRQPLRTECNAKFPADSLQSWYVVVEGCGYFNLEEGQATDGFKAYPNPTHNLVTLSFAEETPLNSELIITNTSGEVIHTYTPKQGATSIDLNLEHLPDGLYFITYQCGRHRQSQKFQKISPH